MVWHTLQTKRAKVKQEMILLTLLHCKGEDVCCSLPRVQIREKRNTFSTLVKGVHYEAKAFLKLKSFLYLQFHEIYYLKTDKNT